MGKIKAETLLAKFKGSLMGTAIGDAIGAPFEGHSKITPEAVYQLTEERKILNYTDDAHMMIGVAESFIENQGFDAKHMAHRFAENFFEEPFRGYGAGPPKIFWMIKAGEPWENASRKFYPGGSYGNGAAMRIAPIGLFYRKNPEMLREVSHHSSAITHAHILGKEGASLQAYAIALASKIDPKTRFDPYDFLKKLREFAGHELYKIKLKDLEMVIGTQDRQRIIFTLGNGVEAFNSIPAAIWSFLTFPDSFENAVLCAVTLGGDADTIGAMTGAISGAYLGIEAIPHKWTSKLENALYIEELADKLWDIYSSQC